MKKLSVESIDEGMVLAREVCGTTGNILLNKGTSLNGALGRRLKNWGIPFVYIEGEDDSPLEQSAAGASAEELKAQLMKKFAGVINNPLMKKLFVAMYQYRLQKSSR